MKESYFPVNSIWISGLSSAGKSTLGTLLVERLREHRCPCVLIDGNEIRDLFAHKLGYDLSARRRQTERVRRLAVWLGRQGILSIVAIIHPCEEDRIKCRDTIQGYFEIHLECPIDVCIERDEKNVYRPALKGETSEVVGLDIPYDEPMTADLILRSDQLEPEELLDRLWIEIQDVFIPRVLSDKGDSGPKSTSI